MTKSISGARKSNDDSLDRHVCRLVAAQSPSSPRPMREPSDRVADALIAADLARRDTLTGSLTPTEAGRARARRAMARMGGMKDVAWLAQHAAVRPGTVDTAHGSVRVVIDDTESPLGWLRRRTDKAGRPLLDDASFEAGERFRADIERAGLRPRITANWTPGPRGPGGSGTGIEDVTLVALAARRRIDAAIEAVGADMAGLLFDVCGFVKGLETVEAERGWPARSAKVVLILALRRLAAHYGLATEARGPQSSQGIRVWMDAGMKAGPPT